MYVEEKKLGETEIDEAGKILLDAADYIERHGWCQNAYQNGLGNVCIVGALTQVVQWPDHPGTWNYGNFAEANKISWRDLH